MGFSPASKAPPCGRHIRAPERREKSGLDTFLQYPRDSKYLDLRILSRWDIRGQEISGGRVERGLRQDEEAKLKRQTQRELNLA
jgi:hypothetical protein